MKGSRLLLCVALIAALALAATACGPSSGGGTSGGPQTTGTAGGTKGPIRVGCKIDVEGPLLGQIIIAVLEKQRVQGRGQDAHRRHRRRAQGAASGQIDIYPEYTANAILVFNKDAKTDPAVLKDAEQDLRDREVARRGERRRLAASRRRPTTRGPWRSRRRSPTSTRSCRWRTGPRTSTRRGAR